MYNIYVLQYSKIVMFWLNIIGYFFSLSYMPMHDMFKKKNLQRKTKAKRIKMLLNMIASLFLGDVWVIGCNLKVIVSIKQLWLCVSVFDSHISNLHNMRHLCTLVMFSHTTRKILCYFWYMCIYNVIWSSQGIHVLMYAH